MGCRVRRTRVSCQTGFGHFKVFIAGICFSGFALATELDAKCDAQTEHQMQAVPHLNTCQFSEDTGA